jgi:predicted  nucleic acid-binding Zn-ribbon protein
MSLAKRVFELQQVEQLIQSGQRQQEEIQGKITRNEAFEQARDNLSAAEKGLAGLEKQYKELDAEAETLRAQIKQVNDKLYGGKIKNPKELQGYEQEGNMLKANLSKKDDTLLELMEKTEAGKIAIRKLKEVHKSAATAWQEEKGELQVQADKLQLDLAALEDKRKEILNSVDRDTLSVYQGIRARKGQAVVKVEQGRCLGCRVTLSISELHHVRGNAIVLCDNCGRILYLS